MLNLEPFFSIIIPTYNRTEQLTNCLQSLTELNYPNFEVIVVDDGSEISLETVVKPFQNQLNLTLIWQKNSGPAMARNTGVKYTKGEFLAFIDDDCIPDVNWLTILANKLTSNPNYLIGGVTINALINNPYATASQALIDYVYSIYNVNRNQAVFFTSNNIALSKNMFIDVLGFNVVFSVASEDREFCDRILSSGYKMIYEPEAIVYHSHNLTLTTFWKQHFNYGKGAYLFHTIYSKRHPQAKSMQSLSFYLKLLTYPLKQQYSQPAFLLSLLFLLSQIATTFGLISEKLSNNAILIKLCNTTGG